MVQQDKQDKQGRPKPSSPASPIPAIPWWISVVVILGALLLAAGAAIALLHPAMLASPNDQINGAVRIYAGYLASRNLALAITLALLLSLQARRTLSSLMMVVALVQFLDAGMDCAEGRWMVAPGVLVIGVVFLFAASRLSRFPFWKAAAWR